MITIRAGHTITVDTRFDLDELVIEDGALLIVNKRIRIWHGPGADMTLHGTLQVGDENVVMLTGSTGIFSSTSTLNIPQSNFRVRGSFVSCPHPERSGL